MQPAPHRRLFRALRYLARLYRPPGIAETVDLDHIKRHYYESHRGLNPTGIVPVGPEMRL
jgi:putative glutathione S-transferase